MRRTFLLSWPIFPWFWQKAPIPIVWASPSPLASQNNLLQSVARRLAQQPPIFQHVWDTSPQIYTTTSPYPMNSAQVHHHPLSHQRISSTLLQPKSPTSCSTAESLAHSLWRSPLPISYIVSKQQSSPQWIPAHHWCSSTSWPTSFGNIQSTPPERCWWRSPNWTGIKFWRDLMDAAEREELLSCGCWRNWNSGWTEGYWPSIRRSSKVHLGLSSCKHITKHICWRSRSQECDGLPELSLRCLRLGGS